MKAGDGGVTWCDMHGDVGMRSSLVQGPRECIFEAYPLLKAVTTDEVDREGREVEQSRHV